ncbi:MAG: TonB-dependent receptor, partial [Chitinophagaceae bacterium]
MKSLLVFLFLFTSATVSAQKINGVILNENKQPIPWATVSLISSTDSAVVKLATTDDKGSYSFADISFGEYKISATAVGLDNATTEVFSLLSDSVTAPLLTLNKKATSLQGVQVTATRPLIQVRADKTILNVEGTINATGSDALELLRKAPGVLVDKDDNLSLSGKSGVQVYIDGKPSPLAGKELSEYLKTVQSAQIESFEIITNPSAKYEAAGNAGIINIRMKKNKSFGTNGTFNAGYGIGTFPKFNGGFTLNNRNAISNVYGTFNASRNKSLGEMFFYRTLGDSIFDQKTTMISRNRNINYKTGVDFFLNKFNTLGIMLHGSNNESESHSNSLTSIFYKPGSSLVKYLRAENTNEGGRNNTNANINYRFADTSGHELNIDLDYGAYRVNSDQWQPNYYIDPSGAFMNSLVYNMVAPTDINLYSIKADYEQDFKKGKLGFGAKVAYVETDNDFQRYNVYTSNKELDTLRSNRFKYKENINALYANYNRPFKGFAVQVGLRLENTVSEGASEGFRQVGQNYISYDSSFKRPYTDLFPSMAVTFNKNPMSQFSFTYSRRIDRPAYQDLNPFE